MAATTTMRERFAGICCSRELFITSCERYHTHRPQVHFPRPLRGGARGCRRSCESRSLIRQYDRTARVNQLSVTPVLSTIAAPSASICAEMSSFKPNTAHRFLRILGRMRISGAFLAEKVEAVDNKLNVKGGVISHFKVGRDRVAQFDIVVLTQGDAGDTGSTERLVVIEVSPPNGGEPLHMHRELPTNLVNADVGFACWQFRLTLNLNGRWIIAMKGPAGTVSLPLTVSGPR
jgi:hypothetical protein